MSCVYVLRYNLPYESTEMVSVYSTLRGAMNRLETMDMLDNFDEDETVTIECQSVISEEESVQRLERMREHYNNKKND